MIVGLAGHKGSGKDTVADYLVRHHSFNKASFAMTMKYLMSTLFQVRVGLWEDQDWKETPNTLMYGHTPRHVLQTFGTEWGRNMVNADIWVNLVLRKAALNRQRTVITDVRFDNEAFAIRNQGGKIIQLSMNEYVNADSHASERGISDMLIDGLVFANKGETERLCRMVEELLDL